MDRNRNQRGQALIELGIVLTLLVVLTLGAVEFGYAFLALHFVTQATAAGARAAAALQVGNRARCGLITAQNQVQTLVTNQLGSIVTVTSVNVSQTPTPPAVSDTTSPCPSLTDIPTVTVTVKGTIPRIFGLLGSSALNFTRTETFRDEGR